MPGFNISGDNLIENNENNEEEVTVEKSENEKQTNSTIENTIQKSRKTAKEKVYRNSAENIMDHLISEERTKVLQTLTHSVMPGFNISLTKSRLKNLSNFPLFQCSIPHSVYVSSEHPNKVDLCHKRTLAHYDYMYNLNRQRAYYENAEKKKNFKKSMKKEVYPYTIVSYAELLENNPDPYFQTRYDWYYTGGNIKCYSDNNIVCHTTGNSLNQLVLSRLKKKSKTYNLKPFKTMDFLSLDELSNSEIFEIQSLALKNRFSIRQKYSLALLTYDENDLICDFIISSDEYPIITSAGDNLDSDIIAMGNLNREVFLWDVRNSTKIPKQKLFQNNLDSENKTKNWNSLCNLDKNIYAFTTLNQFCLLDTRQSANESITNLCTFGKYKEICEDISSLAKSNYDNIIYLGTTHKLFTIDTRFMGKEIQNKYIVQRWTHQMESAPLILKTYNWAENYELIAMSSLLSGDIRICENLSSFKNDKNKYMSTCLPYMPPSLLDGYNAAKLCGECLDPATNLEKRINSCTTGLDFCKKGENLYLMISNSLGDVFSTKLNFYEDVKYSANHNKEIIMKYEDKLKLKLEKNPLPLNLTECVKLQGMSKVLRCKRLNNLITKTDNSNKVDESTVNDEPKRAKRRAKWEKSVSELCAYKDVLAANLLAVWDMELNEEKNNLPVIDKKADKQHEIARVSEWLNQSTFLDDSLPVEESTGSINMVSFNTIIHSTLKPSTQIQTNRIEETDIMNDSFVIDNTLKASIQNDINSANKMELENYFDVTAKSIESQSDTEIPPGQIPIVKSTMIPKKNTKRTYVKGF